MVALNKLSVYCMCPSQRKQIAHSLLTMGGLENAWKQAGIHTSVIQMNDIVAIYEHNRQTQSMETVW